MQIKFDLDHSKLLDRQNIQGYTMVEILAVLSLVGILTAIAVPSLLSMQGANNLNNSVEKVRATLELSQTTAIQKNDSCKVYIPDGSKIVSQCLIAADHTSSGVPSVPDGLPQVNLDNGITLRTINWANSGNPGVNDIPAQVIYNLKGLTQSKGTIILESSATANKKCLVISAGVGLIRNGLYQNNTCEVTE